MNDLNTTQQLQERPEYHQINNLLDQYKRVIEQKFQSNQAHLLQELQQKTIQLKQSIAFYKKQTSAENLEILISKKRHEKELERLELQVQWRNLTEKYKKLQEDEKKINQENRENEFDMQNLQKKILQLQEANKLIEQRVEELKRSAEDHPFMTEVKTDYVSPYKYSQKSVPEQILPFKNKQKTLKPSSSFRLKLQQKLKHPSATEHINKENNPSQNKLPSFAFNCPSSSQVFEHKKAELFNNNESMMNPIQINSMYNYQDNKSIHDRQSKYPLNKNEKWSELTYYLNKPQVRDKIFDLLRKENIKKA